MRFVLLIIFLSFLSFFSYGKGSSDTVKYFYHSKWRSQSSREIKLSGNGDHFLVTSSRPGRTQGFQLDQWRETPSTSRINFKNTGVKNGAGIIIANKQSFKIPVINLNDSFVSKQSTIPYLRNEHAGIWKKVGRAELFIGGVELLGMAVLIAMPKEITKWSDDWAKDAWRNLKRSFSTTPVWDKDDWALNYIGHPIAGSYYYNALRSQNASRFHSFLFSTAQSFIWEYIIEGVAERPSAQDLFITPVVGSMLGEATHLLTMSMRKNGFNFFEKVFVLLLNPMFVINNGFGTRYNPAFAKR